MKSKRSWFIALLVGALLGAGGVLVFRPIAVDYGPVAIGFIVCLVLVAIVRVIGMTLRRKREAQASPEPIRTFGFHWLWISTVLIVVALAGIIFINGQERRTAIEEEYKLRSKQGWSDIEKATRNKGRVVQATNLLQQVEAEAQGSTSGVAEKTILALAAACQSMEPFQQISGLDAVRPNSPERGDLLVQLTHLELDSAIFARLKAAISFQAANLSKAQLSGSDLSGVQLTEAILEGTVLDSANLIEARFTKAWCPGAVFVGSVMTKSNFEQADLSWADFSGTDLRGSNLNGVTMTSAQLSGANFNNIDVKWANLEGIIAPKINLSSSVIYGTNLNRANLKGADLSHANLSKATLMEADLTDVNLEKTGVEEENWLELLSEWRVIGAEALQENYTVVKETNRRTLYRIDRKGSE